MKIEFHKRPKKQTQGEPMNQIMVEDSQAVADLPERPKKPQFQFPGKHLDRAQSNTPSTVQPNTMLKKSRLRRSACGILCM
jgi:hypothetical protein